MFLLKTLFLCLFFSIPLYANSESLIMSEPVASDQMIHFNVWLKLRNQSRLDSLVQEIYNPKSARYQHYLTLREFEKTFAPRKEIENKISDFFNAQGMQAIIVNHSVKVTATAKQITDVLHSTLYTYRLHKSVAYANKEPPLLPSDLTPFISGITGLNTIPTYEAQANPTDISLRGFSGAQLQVAYNLQNISPLNGTKLNGAGQTLVIVDACDTNGPAQILTDANQYFTANHIKPFLTKGMDRNFAIINPDGTPFTTCTQTSKFNKEIALDVESSHTIAPGNNTVLVLADKGDTRTGLITIINQLIQHNFTVAGFPNAFVISNSWSNKEDRADPPLDTALQLAAAFGISVDFSSGDCGDNTYTTPVNPTTGVSKCTGQPGTPSVRYPPSSPYVTAVGATALFVDKSYHYAFETVWGTVSDKTGTLAYGESTSGGISTVFGPVPWQSDISEFTAGGYGVISQYGNKRATPDISMLGDPRTGLLIIEGGKQIQEGGTSMACPLFSATLLLVNQARFLMSRATPIGQAAPYLYQMNQTLRAASALNLIIPSAKMIKNATPPPSTTVPGYHTHAPASAFTIKTETFGWDSSLTVEPEDQFWNDAVGVGSPNIPNFVLTMATL